MGPTKKEREREGKMIYVKWSTLKRFGKMKKKKRKMK